MFCCTWSLDNTGIIFSWQEILFNIAVILCYFVSGIAAGIFAAGWGGPPEACPDPDSPIGDVCDSIPLTATNALECVSAYSCVPV